jgi:hypothetical protein
MSIIKGLFIGVWLFSFGTIAYFLLKGFVPRPGTSFDIRTISFMTVSNPSWYLAFVACLCVGLIVARSWHIHTAIWVGLIVTEFFPAAILALFLVVVRRLKEVAGK